VWTYRAPGDPIAALGASYQETHRMTPADQAKVRSGMVGEAASWALTQRAHRQRNHTSPYAPEHQNHQPYVRKQDRQSQERPPVPERFLLFVQLHTRVRPRGRLMRQPVLAGEQPVCRIEQQVFRSWA